MTWKIKNLLYVYLCVDIARALVCTWFFNQWADRDTHNYISNYISCSQNRGKNRIKIVEMNLNQWTYFIFISISLNMEAYVDSKCSVNVKHGEIFVRVALNEIFRWQRLYFIIEIRTFLLFSNEWYKKFLPSFFTDK